MVSHEAVVEEFFADEGGDWPVIFDDDGRFSVAFGVSKVPETWIIDPDGVVRGRVISEVTADFLSSRIQLLPGASMSTANRHVKRWPGWVALVLVVVGLFAVGVTRDAGPQTEGDRIDAIARRIACPICDGESVYESRNNASVSIRTEIEAQVRDGVRTDDEIIGYIADRYRGDVLLVPRRPGSTRSCGRCRSPRSCAVSPV